MKKPWLLALGLAVGALGVLAAPSPAPAASEAEKQKWGEHMGDLPFIVGYEKGMKEVEFTGKPPMYFFTATW
jgi:hypothetical protein